MTDVSPGTLRLMGQLSKSMESAGADISFDESA